MKYALIEIVNIYDTGLTFEPIHRVLFDIDSEGLMNFIGDKLGGKKEQLSSFDDLKKKIDNSKSDFGFIFEKNGDWKSTRLNSSHIATSRMPSSA